MAGTDTEIRLGIKGDAEVKNKFGEVSAAGKKFESDLNAAGQSPSRSMRALGTVIDDMRGKMHSAAAETGTMGRALSSFGPGGVAAAAGIGGVVLGLRALLRSGREAAAYLDDIGDAADRLGVSATHLQAWSFGFKKVGVDSEELNQALMKLNKNLGDISLGKGKAAAAALEAIGVSAYDSSGNLKTVDELFPEIADGLSQMKNEAERTSVETELLGRAGGKLNGVLREGSGAFRDAEAAARDYGAIADEALIQKSGVAADRIDMLASALKTNLSVALSGAAEGVVLLEETFLGFIKAWNDSGFAGILHEFGGDAKGFFNALTGQKVDFSGSNALKYMAKDFAADAAARNPKKSRSTSKPSVKVTRPLSEEDKQFKKTKDDLQFELEQMRRNSAEKRVAIELRRAGVSAASAEGQQIAAMARQLEASTEHVKKHTGARKEHISALDRENSALDFSISQIGKSNTEQKIAEALKRAGVSATSAEGEQIAAKVRKIEAATSAQKAHNTAARDGIQTANESADAIKRVTDSLTFELEQMKRSETEQRVYDNLQSAGVGINTAAGQAIAAKTRALEAARKEQEKQNEAEDVARSVKQGLLTDMERLKQRTDELADLQRRGLLTAEEYAKAMAQVRDETSGLSQATEGLADSFAGAFTQVITGAGSMRDELGKVLKQIADDLLHSGIKSLLMGGAGAFGFGGQGAGGGGGLGSLLGGLFGGLFGHANGGVMTAAGSLPLPLIPHSMGGIADRPMLSLFGEGSRPEAYVPLPDGRSIPVTVRGGEQAVAAPAVPQITVHQHFQAGVTPGQLHDALRQTRASAIDGVFEAMRRGKAR